MARIKIPFLTQGVVDCSEGVGPNFVNYQFHDHQVTTELYLINIECDLAVNVTYLVPSLKSHCREETFVLYAQRGDCP